MSKHICPDCGLPMQNSLEMKTRLQIPKVKFKRFYIFRWGDVDMYIEPKNTKLVTKRMKAIIEIFNKYNLVDLFNEMTGERTNEIIQKKNH